MISSFKEAAEAFETLADDQSDAAQARYEAAERYLLTTPPTSLSDAIFALRYVVASLSAGGRHDGLELEQSARIQRLMAGIPSRGHP